MTVAVNPDVTLTAGSIDVAIPFVLAGIDGVPIPDATTATVTWVSPSGHERPLTLLTPVSAVFVWYTLAGEFTTAHTEVGRCRVSFPSGARFWTAPFTVAVLPLF